MLKFSFSLASAWLGLCIAPAVAGMVIIDENFDDYADNAAFQAVWGNAGAGSLNAGLGNPGQSASHGGGVVNSQSFAALVPTATEHVRLTGQIFDDALSSNKRLSIGLRNTSGANIIELGFYNGGSHYVGRVVNFDGSGVNPSWVAFPGLTSPQNGWHTFSVEISDNTVDFSLDIGSDGTIDSTMSYASVATSAGFNNLRFGGPSNLSSAGGGANFDNLRLETISVPEPTSAGLCVLLGGLCMVRRRRS